MAADLGPDIAKLERVRGVLESVKAYIADRAARQQAAVEAALALGATEEQLAPVRASIAVDSAMADEVADAMVANP